MLQTPYSATYKSLLQLVLLDSFYPQELANNPQPTLQLVPTQLLDSPVEMDSTYLEPTVLLAHHKLQSVHPLLSTKSVLINSIQLSSLETKFHVPLAQLPIMSSTVTMQPLQPAVFQDTVQSTELVLLAQPTQELVTDSPF